MDFKNLILLTSLLNISIAFCAPDQDPREDYDFNLYLPAGALIERKINTPGFLHLCYLIDHKIPIYNVRSNTSEHDFAIDEPSIKLIQAIDAIKLTADSLEAKIGLANVRAALAAGANPNVTFYNRDKLYNFIGGHFTTSDDEHTYGNCHAHSYIFESALTMAISRYRYDIVEALILAGADVNLQDIEDVIDENISLTWQRAYSPLMWAIIQHPPFKEFYGLGVMTFLLKHGADINAISVQNDKSFTALEYARENNYHQTTELLQNYSQTK